MMKLISRFIKLSSDAVEMEVGIEAISTLPVVRKLMRMGEEIGEDKLDQFAGLNTELDEAFTDLMRNTGPEAQTHES